MTFINSKDPRFCDSTRDLKNATRPNNCSHAKQHSWYKAQALPLTRSDSEENSNLYLFALMKKYLIKTQPHDWPPVNVPVIGIRLYRINFTAPVQLRTSPLYLTNFHW